jgi:hypothetical protein
MQDALLMADIGDVACEGARRGKTCKAGRTLAILSLTYTSAGKQDPHHSGAYDTDKVSRG